MTLPLVLANRQRPVEQHEINPSTSDALPNAAAGFAFVRSFPGSLLRNPLETYVIAPAVGQGV